MSQLTTGDGGPDPAPVKTYHSSNDFEGGLSSKRDGSGNNEKNAGETCREEAATWPYNGEFQLCETDHPSPTGARPWEPVTVTNYEDIQTDPDKVPDADPDAEVVIRPDRDVFITTTTDRTAYHLFADCRHLNDAIGATEIASMGTVWREALDVCTECERREQLRVMLNDGAVPPNPDPGEEWLPGDSDDVTAPSTGTLRRKILDVLAEEGCASSGEVAADLSEHDARAVASALSRLKSGTPLVEAATDGVTMQYSLTEYGQRVVMDCDERTIQQRDAR